MTHIIVLLVLGVLLFGKRLPEVGRSVGKMLMELKRNLNNFEQNLESGDFGFRQNPAPPPVQPQMRPPQRVAPSGRKFEDAPPAAPESPSSPIV
jgi:sec-independent protein translocase protein TatA